MSVSSFMQHTSLPNSPVVAVDPAAFSGVYSGKGWSSHPGPVTPVTFSRPATDLQTVLMKNTTYLPGRVITVPYNAFYGPGGWSTLGWVLGP